MKQFDTIDSIESTSIGGREDAGQLLGALLVRHDIAGESAFRIWDAQVGPSIDSRISQ